MAKQKDEQLSFEDALNQLETLVESMEQGDLSLEESLSSFERGVVLSRSCEAALQAAEQKVEILSKASPDADPEPFDSEH